MSRPNSSFKSRGGFKSDRLDPYFLARGAGAQLADMWGNHDIAVVLGSGWSEAADTLGETIHEIPATDLPGFAAPTVEGHGATIASIMAGPASGNSDANSKSSSGNHSSGNPDTKKVLLFRGRVHLYEGHSSHAVVHGVRVAAAAGCQTLILTNAAGGLRPELKVGTPVLLSDHINMTGMSPLTGPTPPRPRAVRFVDLTDAYSPRLRQIAKEVDPEVAEGIYVGLCGPHFETPAEIRMFAQMGAHVVGMSTVLECIAARHMGMEVMGVSLVTNPAAGVSDEPLDHEEVLEAGRQAGKRVGTLLRGVIDGL